MNNGFDLNITMLLNVEQVFIKNIHTYWVYFLLTTTYRAKQKD